MTQTDASSRKRSSGALLRHPLHSGHLTVGALKRNKDKPVLFLGDTTLTGRQLADRISQYASLFDDPDRVNTEVARYDAVTAADVRRVMAERATADNRLVLTYVPEPEL